MEENKITRFTQLIKDSKTIVFFGGAGVSTESGMKDYRSEDGLYNTVKQYKASPETILSRSFLVSILMSSMISTTTIFSTPQLSRTVLIMH